MTESGGAIAQAKCLLFARLPSFLHTDQISLIPKLNVLETLGSENMLPRGLDPNLGPVASNSRPSILMAGDKGKERTPSQNESTEALKATCFSGKGKGSVQAAGERNSLAVTKYSRSSAPC